MTIYDKIDALKARIDAIRPFEGEMLAIIPPILRREYIQALEKAHTSDAAFVQFIAEREYESEKKIIRLLNIE